MSKPVFSDLFRISPRRNRLSYFLLNLVLWAATFVLTVLVMIPASMIMSGLDLASSGPVGGGHLPPATMAVFAIMIVLHAPIMLIGILAVIQRCHDFGWSGWAVLLYLVPIVGSIFWLALFFIPGTRGPNRYGPDPREAYPPA